MIHQEVVNTFQYFYYNYFLFIDEVFQTNEVPVISPTNDSDTRELELNNNETDGDKEQLKKFILMPIDEAEVLFPAIERDFMRFFGRARISQSNNYCSGEMVVSNRSVKKFELSKNGIWQQQLVCDKSCTTSLHEVTVIMITIATSLQ